ncbi:hypothetical protein DPMN_136230 [Dreissena polymorpha]|uniref:Uncharacterized protein n=1 Tax=Dreissena polymorpha TaxID=45954 RepID=A0A9D4G385_DREPO|nr:hypothetical protein DPMN_136230 [Dreissena polymorpha]
MQKCLFYYIIDNLSSDNAYELLNEIAARKPAEIPDRLTQISLEHPQAAILVVFAGIAK